MLVEVFFTTIRTVEKRLWKGCLYVWVGPWSFVGLGIGLLGLATGGRAQIRRGVVEFYGGAASRFLHLLPNGKHVLAFTLGHTIIGKDGSSLNRARDHEHIHVAQYEKWGPVMGPAYLLWSAYLWWDWQRPIPRQSV